MDRQATTAVRNMVGYVREEEEEEEEKEREVEYGSASKCESFFKKKVGPTKNRNKNVNRRLISLYLLNCKLDFFRQVTTAFLFNQQIIWQNERMKGSKYIFGNK
ncbi:hypothetical protein M514_22284, partial [Trichuris suis]